jgi:hypothetical protein
MLTFDIFANVELTKVDSNELKKSFGSLTPKETITQASTMVDTHIKIKPRKENNPEAKKKKLA